MNLKNQLSEKLLLIKEKAVKSEEAYKYCFLLIKSFFAQESIDNQLNRTFALRKSELEDTYKKLCRLLEYYKTFENHKEIILFKETTIKNALDLLSELSDNFSNIIAEIQGLTIFLENRLKDK